MVEQRQHQEITVECAPQGVLEQPPESANTDALIGTIVGGRYEIIETLGSGGMGAVFKARHLQLNKLVAVKILRAEESASQAFKRFESEAQTASKLAHPNLAVVHDYGATEDCQPYIVMELAEGDSLDRLLKERGRLSTELIAAIFLQICDGLEHAHSKGIIHRDLKPSNIMISLDGDALPPGGVKIVDFGIAKATEENQNLTKTGEICGSPYYMSPEQSLGQKIDVRSDIYSLGCVLYEALTGSPPFKGENAMQTLMKHVMEEPPPFSAEVQAAVPIGLQNITFKAMARQPGDRYQCVGDMRADVEHVALGKQPTAKRRRKKLLLNNVQVAVLTALVCLAIAVVYKVNNYKMGVILVGARVISMIPPWSDTEQGIKYLKGMAEMCEQHGWYEAENGFIDAIIGRQLHDPVAMAETELLRARMESRRPGEAGIAVKHYADSFEKIAAGGDEQFRIAVEAHKAAKFADSHKAATEAIRLLHLALDVAPLANIPADNPLNAKVLTELIPLEAMMGDVNNASAHMSLLKSFHSASPADVAITEQRIREVTK